MPRSGARDFSSTSGILAKTSLRSYDTNYQEIHTIICITKMQIMLSVCNMIIELYTNRLLVTMVCFTITH